MQMITNGANGRDAHIQYVVVSCRCKSLQNEMIVCMNGHRQL